MYDPGPSEQQLRELEAAGFGVQDVATETIGIWPDNLLAYEAFAAMATQWRVGMAGATGLDYAAIPVVLRMVDAPRAAWAQLYTDLRVMEAAALEAMRRKE